MTRRAFLAATAAAFASQAPLQAQPPAREELYNGVRLPAPWPPRRHTVTREIQRPSYLASPPRTINIDRGRQLFVDDFLIEESTLHRAFHAAAYHPASPVLVPSQPWEKDDPYGRAAGTAPSEAAMVFSDGVFFDPADRLFKMWYMGGYQQHTALAVSADGISWRRPALDVVRGTNIVLRHHRDSSTVWIDHETTDRSARFKMASYEFDDKSMHLYSSADGVHWRPTGIAGPCGDRSSMFRNPFRGIWAFSLRADNPGTLTRVRHYVEAPEFASAKWRASDPVPWTGADAGDLQRPELRTPPQLYNLDAVAYESVMLGLFTIYRGETRDREKPNDLCVGFSRDGFQWSREWRQPFLAVSERQGDWNWANVQSAGGICTIVGDQLYFYVSGRRGIPGTNLPGICSTGLATLRRDGFASVSDRFPPAAPRPARTGPPSLITRPLTFSGAHLFVNAIAAGSITVEVLDREGRVIEPFSAARCVPVSGDGTKLPVRWQGAPSIASLAGREVRFRFELSDASLYAFWVSDSTSGRSRGFVAAGGPAYASDRDGQ